MPVRIENHSSVRLSSKVERFVQDACDVLPVEHLRGLGKIVLVDFTDDSRLTRTQREELPGLYLPKLGGAAAWAQVAAGVLLPRANIFKRLVARITFRANLTQVVLSLAAQHYYLTLGRGTKKTQLEGAVRSYTEKYFKLWRERAHPIRHRIFRPIQPWLERMGRKLQKRYQEEARKEKKR